jgi:methylmalonyl-CoA/ethylmalonyl-CoA epimerase
MSGDDRSRLPMLDGHSASQVGILVDDLESALERYEALWGGPWRGFHYEAATVPQLTYRGAPGTYAVTIAINQTTPQVELLQVTAGPSIYHEWLESRGYGLHHLGFWVDSVEEAIASMTATGYELIQSGAGYGLDGDGGYAYFDTERDFSVILEAIELPRRRREPDFVWPP